MRPLTDHKPKPLLEAGGKPLIVWHIEKLVRAGITELVINHAHLGAQIEATLGDGSRFGARIQYSPEARALETAGGIANALPLLGDEPFAVINSDIYCDYDFAHLPERATALQTSGDMAHLVLVDNPPHHPSGDFALNGSRIVPPTSQPPLTIREESCSFPDKGRLGGVELLTFSGIGLYRPSLFNPIPRGGSAPLAPLLREQIALGKIRGEHYRGLWIDVGTPQRLAELDSQICSLHPLSSLQKTHLSSHNAP
jgi:MurNAc alpha-1-phosphate uridylyltransferase